MAEQNKPLPIRMLVLTVFVVLVAPLLPMIIASEWDWWEAWAYAAASILSFVVSRAIAARVHPDVIAERAHTLEARNTKPWDKILAPLLALGSILILVTAGLDRLVGALSPFSTWAKFTALAGIVIGYAFSSWALVENRFFSGTVRIQTERGHHVISSGPYRLIRHPGYAGGLLGYMLIPVLLDSLWAFVPAVLLGIVMIARTALEDKTLQTELPGYAEYAQRTRYRLIPGVW